MKTISLAMLLLTVLFTQAQNTYNEITLPDLLRKASKDPGKYVILDVRTKGEYHDSLSSSKHLNIGHIKNALNIPLQDLTQNPDAIQQLDQYKDKEVYVICSHSYRSRTISNLLTANGFANVTNVKGGMSEWFRNYEELRPFREKFYEEGIAYNNISPEELYKKIESGQGVEFIGFANPPRTNFDSTIVSLYKYLPDFKNVKYFTLADSLKILDKAKQAYGKTIVTFNTIGPGGAEAADWLAQKGISNVNYLVGNIGGFYEYLMNYRTTEDQKKIMDKKSGVNFYTPLSFCKQVPSNFQFIDLRHDTSFNKATNGVKLTYKELKGSTNFPFYKNPDEFAAKYSDKSKMYVLIPQQGYVGLELADALIKKGYSIGWLQGGIERWEWYTNNVAGFDCGGYLVK